MTAAKRAILLCDYQTVCQSRFLGNLREPLGQVRRRAKEDGWESWPTSQDMFRVTVDLCPTHARSPQ